MNMENKMFVWYADALLNRIQRALNELRNMSNITHIFEVLLCARRKYGMIVKTYKADEKVSIIFFLISSTTTRGK